MDAKGSFVRVGDADLHMNDYELYSFEEFRKHTKNDERKVERAQLADLQNQQVQKYVEARTIGKPRFASLPEKNIYEILNITRDNVPTLAAVMSFGIYPQGFFPAYCITAVVVPGTRMGDVSEVDAGSGSSEGNQQVRFPDNQRIEGTIPEMLDEALAFCRRNMKTQTIFDTKTGKRTDRTEYPIDALREAILNALIHRDYSVHTAGSGIQVEFFTDRVEIHSPGSLYGRTTVDQLGVSRTDQRNPVLAIMIESLTGSENRYSGIPTMRRTMREFGLPQPEFENRRNEFVVTLRNSIKDMPITTVNDTYRNIQEDKFENIQDGAAYEVSANQSYQTQQSQQSHQALQLQQSHQVHAEKLLMEKLPLEKLQGTPEKIVQLLIFCQVPRSRQEIAQFMDIKTVNYVTAQYVLPLVHQGLLTMTIPESPRSRQQRYVINDELSQALLMN